MNDHWPSRVAATPNGDPATWTNAVRAPAKAGADATAVLQPADEDPADAVALATTALLACGAEIPITTHAPTHARNASQALKTRIRQTLMGTARACPCLGDVRGRSGCFAGAPAPCPKLALEGAR